MSHINENAFYGHLDFFPSKFGAVSDGHGERFYHEISLMESKYKGRLNTSMIGDYFGFLQRYTTEDHKQKAKSAKRFWCCSM